MGVEEEGLVIEEMKVKHLEQVLSIERASFPAPWSYRAFLYEILHNDFACYVVIRRGDRVIGYAGMWVVFDEAHMTNIAVHPDYRGRRIGFLLMLEMIHRAVSLGAKKMTLEVRKSNVVARRLYSRLGFVERGVRKRYYSDNGEDAIIMWKDDLTAPLF